MNADTLQKLRAADQEGYEFPRGFDWRKEMPAVEALVWDLERILGVMLKVDDQIQDASYFAELYNRHLNRGKNYWETSIGFLFSSFGHLFTHGSNTERERPPDDAIRRAVEFIESKGFVFVDADQLDERYDGIMTGLHDRTWMDRYFSYL